MVGRQAGSKKVRIKRRKKQISVGRRTERGKSIN